MNTLWHDLIHSPEKSNFNHCQNFSLYDVLDLSYQSHHIQKNEYHLNPGYVIHLKQALNSLEISRIQCLMTELAFYPVGIDGNAGNYQTGDTISSYRTSCYDIAFSSLITQRLEGLIPNQRHFEKTDFSVEDNTVSYTLAGFNPYNRLIKYDACGQLIPHYDGQFQFNLAFTTLMTGLLYLSDTQGGCTVFLKDNQTYLPPRQRQVSARDFSDADILLSIKPGAGDLLLFDQQLLHATTPLNHENKSLILTDLVYQKNG
jgi:hypothetical protein